jgi:hypothetical protein
MRLKTLSAWQEFINYIPMSFLECAAAPRRLARDSFCRNILKWSRSNAEIADERLLRAFLRLV